LGLAAVPELGVVGDVFLYSDGLSAGVRPDPKISAIRLAPLTVLLSSVFLSAPGRPRWRGVIRLKRIYNF
jgi:hypothetical protein